MAMLVYRRVSYTIAHFLSLFLPKEFHSSSGGEPLGIRAGKNGVVQAGGHEITPFWGDETMQIYGNFQGVFLIIVHCLGSAKVGLLKKSVDLDVDSIECPAIVG